MRAWGGERHAHQPVRGSSGRVMIQDTQRIHTMQLSRRGLRRQRQVHARNGRAGCSCCHEGTIFLYVILPRIFGIQARVPPAHTANYWPTPCNTHSTKKRIKTYSESLSRKRGRDVNSPQGEICSQNCSAVLPRKSRYILGTPPEFASPSPATTSGRRIRA